MMFIMLKLAKTIQYLQSMGFVLSDRIRLDDIYVDWEFQVRISPTELVWYGNSRSLQEVGQRSETGIYTFGSVFCMIYFGTSESSCTTSQATRTSLYKPGLGAPGDVGQLIQQCLSAEGKPTIDDIVQEMESWKIRQDLQSLSGTCRPPYCTITHVEL
ncbi:hypothetical protein M378DRAFT_999570 [Amanita muscaria Koide BX008]|uniref:Uncharacterized protein n=1 Tax=Amanita muscaria (strain Koide BX008) TaxID=946122 RepID=A0A0C2SZR4_AMAMK|nr:hypothetical protein M378DRAFT_999570 [Amanita muscaria Koide BX008]